jgi:hypothetical protein
MGGIEHEQTAENVSKSACFTQHSAKPLRSNGLVAGSNPVGGHPVALLVALEIITEAS